MTNIPVPPLAGTTARALSSTVIGRKGSSCTARDSLVCRRYGMALRHWGKEEGEGEVCEKATTSVPD